MDETNFIDKKALKHFEKQLASRDKYVKENVDYIETKRDKIGLSSSEILAELCFALYMEDEIDDDGDNWNIAYMYYKIYYDYFNPSKNHEGTLKELGILADLAENPKVIERLNISLDDIQDYYNDIWTDQMDDSFINHKKISPKKKSSALHISRCTGELFRQMQDHQIKAKEQIEFVMDLYSDFKYFDFNDEDIDGSKFRRVEKQRERSLKHKQFPQT